ncbi:MAG: hypothetical protein LBL48_07460 [Azoarcus sp.]|nr:hypothetical protein [Azoarcus sp.]
MKPEKPKPKSPVRRPDPVARLAWICLALSVAIAFYWLIWGFARPLPEPVAPDPAMLAVRPVAPPAPAPEAVAAITARPLFLPGRQAQGHAFPGAMSAPVETDTLGGVRLIGVASELDGGIAIISHGGRQSRVRQGEEFDGWTLDRIQDNVAYFVRGGEMRDLPLMRGAGQTPPGGALGGGAPRPPPYPNIPPGARPPGGGMPDGAPQMPYPYMPPNARAPAGGMPDGASPPPYPYLPPGAESIDGMPPSSPTLPPPGEG